MKKSDLILGACLSLLSSLIGSVLFVFFFTHFGIIEGVQFLWAAGKMGKLLSLGALLNLLLFFGLLKWNKEIMARGVVLGSLLLTLLTLIL